MRRRRRIRFDKFHLMCHLGDALDAVRKTEYPRTCGKDRRYIKGKEHAALAPREPHDGGPKLAKMLLAANKRLNTADLLKESFGQLWDYEREGWARRFFENWRATLNWQRLRPYEKFAQMIDRHWDGIATYCLPRTRCDSDSSRGRTTRSVSSSAAHTDCVTRSTCD